MAHYGIVRVQSFMGCCKGGRSQSSLLDRKPREFVPRDQLKISSFTAVLYIRLFWTVFIYLFSILRNSLLESEVYSLA